ncbi:hypothetical protein ESA94_20375 [Lacibacter luteus]|uniref:Phage head morphogenesis domain-containing protein n=1 Tax=Lacibacter luteus TaxID=2508719 RepID=A0A4Q1CDW4_9BACT|nr:minor capsid protein [Lacibacter luteus]RXK57557.1 hypothetical protein ESA94_20375 [Lacibacter luteus]
MYKQLTASYGSVCPNCGGHISLPSLADNGGPYDAILDQLAADLWERKVKTGTIPKELFEQTSKDILKTIDEGLGGKAFDITDGRNTLKAYYQQNLSAFSAAKSYTEMLHMRSLMADAADFTDFRNKCLDAGIQFNQTWLKTEYETFTAAAQMGKQYDDFVKNGIDVLEFTTVGDDRVRPAHAELDGLTFRIDAPYVKQIWPPLDWACRCHLIPGIDAKITDDATAGRMVKDAVRNPLFKQHAGIDKVVVSNDHPYFNAAPKELTATKNYGLPSVKHQYNQNSFPARIEMASEQEYRAWWKDQVNIERSDNFVLKDKTGVHILFDSPETPGNNKAITSYFKEHILKNSNEERWMYAANLTEIITKPDELWSVRRSGNKIARHYIKYYNDAPILVMVEDKEGVMTAQTMYELTEERATEFRRGELLYINR